MTSINIVDVEASGLHFDSYPIEIAVLVNGVCKSWLIKPRPGWTYWNEMAESMHGITRSELFAEGKDAGVVAKELLVFLDDTNGVLYSDAAYWDNDWLDTLFFSVREAKTFHVGSVYDLLKKDQISVFDEIKAKLATSGKYRPHRAESDVRMIAEAYRLAALGRQ